MVMQSLFWCWLALRPPAGTGSLSKTLLLYQLLSPMYTILLTDGSVYRIGVTLQGPDGLNQSVTLERWNISLLRLVALLPLLACLFGVLAVGASLLQPSLLV